MSRTMDAIEWVAPFNVAAEGRTSEALDQAEAEFAEASDDVRSVVIRNGLRQLLHASRRFSSIRVNGDAETLPLFVAIDGDNGVVTHRPRFLVPVGEIVRQLDKWAQRQDEAAREVRWWTHQRDLAIQAKAEDDEQLGDVWQRLGLDYALLLGPAEASA